MCSKKNFYEFETLLTEAKRLQDQAIDFEIEGLTYEIFSDLLFKLQEDLEFIPRPLTTAEQYLVKTAPEKIRLRYLPKFRKAISQII